MTKEEKEAVLHCLRSMIDEELCEECPLYGTTGTDHCEKDCVRLAIEELEQEPCDKCVYSTSEGCQYDDITETIPPFETSDDAISRQAVLDTLENMDRALDEDRTVESYKELLRECYKVLPPVKPKSEWEHDHEILKAYSDGASAVLESLIEQYEHYLELLDADMKDGSATIVTKTKYAVYAEVVKQLKEVLESEGKA